MRHGTSAYTVSPEGPAPTSHSGIRTGDARIIRSLFLRSNHCAKKKMSLLDDDLITWCGCWIWPTFPTWLILFIKWWLIIYWFTSRSRILRLHSDPLPVKGYKFRPMLLWAGRGLYRVAPTATRSLGLYGIIRKTGTHVPQCDSNPRHKDYQIFAPGTLTTAPRGLSNEVGKRSQVIFQLRRKNCKAFWKKKTSG
jgi:hypothetical protein